MRGEALGRIVVAYEPVWAIGAGAIPRPRRRSPPFTRASMPGSLRPARRQAAGASSTAGASTKMSPRGSSRIGRRRPVRRPTRPGPALLRPDRAHAAAGPMTRAVARSTPGAGADCPVARQPLSGRSVEVPQLFGSQLSRGELLRRVGRLEQAAGIRLVSLGDGQGRGVRLLEVRTGTGFAFDIIVDRAFDIGRCELGGIPLAWQSGAGIVGPWYGDPDGWGWLRTWGGGMLATCGLDHTLAPGEGTAAHFNQPHLRATVRYGLHGRVGSLPARLVGYGERWNGDECVLWAEGEVLQSAVFGEELILRRRIEAQVGASRITIHDVVENVGHTNVSHMYLYHCNIGFPVVDAGARIVADVVVDTDRLRRARRRLRPPHGPDAERHRGVLRTRPPGGRRRAGPGPASSTRPGASASTRHSRSLRCRATLCGGCSARGPTPARSSPARTATPAAGMRSSGASSRCSSQASADRTTWSRGAGRRRDEIGGFRAGASRVMHGRHARDGASCAAASPRKAAVTGRVSDMPTGSLAKVTETRIDGSRADTARARLARGVQPPLRAGQELGPVGSGR